MQRFLATNSHPTTDYSFINENQNQLLAANGGQVDAAVDDEGIETFFANLLGRSGVALRGVHTRYGETIDDGGRALSLSGTTSEISAADMEGVSHLFLTFSGLTAGLNGLAGGVEGRTVWLTRVDTSTLTVVTLGHLAGSPTPSGSRLFLQGLAGLTFGPGARRQAVYHSGLWYLG
jgi:hypothetical protein